MFPFYAGTKPTIWGAYTDIPSAQILGTSAAGKLENRGSNLTLTKLGVGSLLYSEWGIAPTLAGTVTLTNPLYLLYQVDNSSVASITLPSIGSYENPNFVIFIPLGLATITFNGAIFGPAGDVSSFTTNGATIFYCNYSTSKWHTISVT